MHQSVHFFYHSAHFILDLPQASNFVHYFFSEWILFFILLSLGKLVRFLNVQQD